MIDYLSYHYSLLVFLLEAISSKDKPVTRAASWIKQRTSADFDSPPLSLASVAITLFSVGVRTNPRRSVFFIKIKLDT